MKKILLFISSAFILGMNSVYAQPENASVSLGATLSEEQKSQTLNVLDANNVEEDKIHLIDGDKLNEYLNDGSDSSTNIYSSSKVEQIFVLPADVQHTGKLFVGEVVPIDYK